jgi:hypothetical protein
MKVVNPNDATHTTTFIPRFKTGNALVLYLFNEASQETVTVANTYTIVNGNARIVYDYTFTDNQKFQIKITDGTDVIYRGKLIATTQTPESYKLTDSTYIYG